jgi:hypothetical protein
VLATAVPRLQLPSVDVEETSASREIEGQKSPLWQMSKSKHIVNGG